MPTDPTDAERLVEGLEQAARTYWPALLIEGIALILFGILALFIPPLITFGIATTLGWVFLFGGTAALLVCAWILSTRSSIKSPGAVSGITCSAGYRAFSNGPTFVGRTHQGAR